MGRTFYFRRGCFLGSGLWLLWFRGCRFFGCFNGGRCFGFRGGATFNVRQLGLCRLFSLFCITAQHGNRFELVVPEQTDQRWEIDPFAAVLDPREINQYRFRLAEDALPAECILECSRQLQQMGFSQNQASHGGRVAVQAEGFVFDRGKGQRAHG